MGDKFPPRHSPEHPSGVVAGDSVRLPSGEIKRVTRIGYNPGRKREWLVLEGTPEETIVEARKCEVTNRHHVIPPPIPDEEWELPKLDSD